MAENGHKQLQIPQRNLKPQKHNDKQLTPALLDRDRLTLSILHQLPNVDIGVDPIREQSQIREGQFNHFVVVRPMCVHSERVHLNRRLNR